MFQQFKSILSVLSVTAASIWSGTEALAQQSFQITGSACHAITPAQADKMEWRTSGLINNAAVDSYWVQCPVLKFGDAETFSVQVNFQNNSDLEVEVGCNIREYKQGRRVKGMAGSIVLSPGQYSSEMVWNGGFTADSHVNVACLLPAQVALESVVSEASGGGSAGSGRPPEIYLKSNGEQVAIYPLWAYDTAVTEKGYWFRAVPFISATNTSTDLQQLGGGSAFTKVYLGNDPQCEGQAFGPDSRMPVDDYKQKGLLFSDRETGSVLYGNFSEARIISVYYTKDNNECKGPYESRNPYSMLPLYENDPSITGWHLGTIIPNPSVGYL